MNSFIEKLSGALSSRFFYLFAFLLAALVFWPVISQNPLVDIDYDLVINPLRQVHSLADYAKAFVGPRLLDVQPVRDFSLLIDIKLESLIGHQVFGFFNLIFWLGSCFFLEKILRKFCEPLYARLITLIVLIHPLLSWVLSWPTARKHILACFFLMIASWMSILYKEGKERLGIWILLFYTLSVYSQPIGLLWIGVFVLYLGKDALNKRHWPLIGLLGVVFIFTTLVNYVYFDQVYPMLVGIEKTSAAGAHSNGLKIISFSRSLSQIILPLQYAAEYAFHSLLGYLGLPLFFIILWILSHKLNRKKLFLGVLFALHPLMLINFRSTNIFVSDTYLLIPLTGLGIVLGMFISKFEMKRSLIFIFTTLSLILGVKANYETRISTQELSYFQVGFQREPNCRNALAYANHLLKIGDFKIFYDVAGRAMSNNCLFGGNSSIILMSQVYAFRVFLDEKIEDIEKASLISKVSLSSNIIYLQILLNAKLGKEDMALRKFRLLNKDFLTLKTSLQKLHHQTCLNQKICEQILL